MIEYVIKNRDGEIIGRASADTAHRAYTLAMWIIRAKYGSASPNEAIYLECMSYDL